MARPISLISALLLGLLVLLLPVATAAETSEPKGKATFEYYCALCHGVNAEGDDPFFPSVLAAAKNKSPEEFIRILLTGRYDTTDYNAGHSLPMMPPWDHLGNEDIAAVANYIYRTAAVDTRPTTPSDVASARGESMEDPIVPLSPAQLQRTSNLYFDRCAGCHGVDRKGSAGNPLVHWLMRARGDSHIREILNYGTPWGMPNWGSTNELSSEDMSLLSRFLQIPPPTPPDYTFADIKKSWRQIVPVKERPTKRQFPVAAEHLFVSLQHDTGQLLLIDENTQQIVATIDAGIAPNDIDLSKDGRYLYVIRRDGYVGLIDLYMEKPTIVAEVRVGLEARSIAVTQTKRPARVVTGAYWPGHYAVLNGLTLKPIRSTALGVHGARVSQVTNIPGSLDFLLATKNSEELSVISSGARGRKPNSVNSFEMPALLRGGSFDSNGQYFLIPTEESQVVVFNRKKRQLEQTIEAPSLFGGSVGATYKDPTYGPAWISSAMHSPFAVVVGTDPLHNPDNAWKVVRQVSLPSAGSVFIAAHPQSRYVWADLPMSAISTMSESILAIDFDGTAPQVHRLPVARWAGLNGQQARAIHPQFNSDGSEVWVTLWSRQDMPSAIVIVDSATLKLKKVIRDPRLITPIRTYSLGTLMQRGN